jgi:hypothetical protein
VVVPPPSRDGGPTTQVFQYDDLYRLTGASGSYLSAPGKTDRHTLAHIHRDLADAARPMMGLNMSAEVCPAGKVSF